MTTRKRSTAWLLGQSIWVLASAVPAKAQSPEVVLTVSAEITEPKPGFDNDSANLSAASALEQKRNVAMAPTAPMNPAAVKFVQAYIRDNNEVLQKVQARSNEAFKIIEPILAKYDLPVELKYLAVVESDLKSSAVSRVGAAGPWQLMPTTARELGLHVSRKWDERKHYTKSTIAAAKYLRDLYHYYNDWLLVIAAYNAGPVVVDRAIRRAGNRNFWKLQYFLPAETRGHVKRFIGTHYFFEDGGSQTTLTKAEATAYAKAVEKFYSTQQSEVTAMPIASFVSQVQIAIANR